MRSTHTSQVTHVDSCLTTGPPPYLRWRKANASGDTRTKNLVARLARQGLIPVCAAVKNQKKNNEPGHGRWLK